VEASEVTIQNLLSSADWPLMNTLVLQKVGIMDNAMMQQLLQSN